MSVHPQRDLIRLIAIIGVWWSAITLLVSTNTAQRFLAPVWNAIGIGAADVALMPLGAFLGVRFVVWSTEAAEKPQPALLMDSLVTLIVLLVLGSVVFLFQADYYGSWTFPLDFPWGLLIGAVGGGVAALVIFLVRNP